MELLQEYKNANANDLLFWAVLILSFMTSLYASKQDVKRSVVAVVAVCLFVVSVYALFDNSVYKFHQELESEYGVKTDSSKIHKVVTYEEMKDGKGVFMADVDGERKAVVLVNDGTEICPYVDGQKIPKKVEQ